MNVVSRILLFALCASFGLGVSASPQTHVAATQRAFLRHAIFELPPWSVKQANGFEGAHVSIVRRLAERMGAEVEHIECSVDRCLELLQQGEADIVTGLKSTIDRQRYLLFLDPPILKKGYAKVFYLRKDDSRHLSTYEDLYQFSVGAVKGSRLFDRFDRDDKLRIDYAGDTQANFRKLIMGRIDIVASPEGLAEYSLSILQLRDQVRKAEFRVEDANPRRLALSRSSAWMDNVAPLTSELKQMHQRHEIASIIDTEYFEKYAIPHTDIEVH